MSEEDLYDGREQTLVKHFILREYLERFAHIIGFRWDAITYVDCFSGPWNVRSAELKDASFSIALDELRKARETHQKRGKTLRLRCFFLEKDPAAFAKLKEFADKVADAEVRVVNETLQSAMGEVLDFIGQGGRASFPFIFIDPTGWTGFEMSLIAPLLQLRPGEVLINFMTDYIRRFIDHPEKWVNEQFAALFGSEDVKAAIEAFSDKQDREDALLRKYAETIQKTGKFSHTCAATILYPTIDRSYFHLIYATRDRRGVEVFKEVEKRAAEVMERKRADVKQRRRIKKTRQMELFESDVMPHSTPIDDLRRRFVGLAREKTVELLQGSGRTPYEAVWDMALSYPLVWESDVKDWIKEWRANGSMVVEGFKARQQVPKLDEKNFLIWKGIKDQGTR